MTVPYKPISMLASVLGGLLATRLFSQVWRVAAGEDHAPSARDPEYSWKQIAMGALVRGAIFGAVKAVIERVGAWTFARATGRWPA